MDITRRQGLQLAAGAALAAGASTATPVNNELGLPRRVPNTGKGIKFATMNGARPDHKARVSRQIGVNYAICGANSAASRATTMRRHSRR